MSDSVKTHGVGDDSDLVEDAGRGRQRLRPDIVPELLAWFLMHWNRKVNQQTGRPALAGPELERWRAGLAAGAECQLRTIQELSGCLVETFKASEYHQSLVMAQTLIGATDDNGRPLSRIGAALLKLAGEDGGSRTGTRGHTVPVNPGETPEPNVGA